MGASGFQIHAMLYSGPARTFDYGATYHLSVDVEVKKRLIGRPKTWVKAGWARLMGKPRHRPASRASAEDKQLHGSTRFIMAEPSAPTTQPTPQEIARTGRVEVISPDRRAELVHELTHDHTPVNADDLLADLLGSKGLADQIEELLLSKGIGRFDARELTLWSTNVTQLEGMQVRGPSEQHPSMVIKGTVVNTHVDVWLESFPVNTRDVGDRYTFMKMDVAEGGPIVTSAKEKRRVWTWGFSFWPLFGIGDYSDTSVPTAANWGHTRHRGKGRGLLPQTGRLTQIPQPYQEKVADVIWRITITPRKKNMWGSFRRGDSERFVRIHDGIHYLRPVTPRPRPQPPPPTHHPAPTTTTATTAAPLAPAGAFPEHLSRLPLSAATERLLATSRTRQLTPSGEENVLLDVLTQVFKRGAKKYLKRRWTIVGMADFPPTRLTGIANPGSGMALWDLLKTGVVLESTRSGLFHHQRMWVELRAVRDPRGEGYMLVEVVDNVNVSIYSFRLNITATSAGTTKSDEVAIGGSPFGWVLGLLRTLGGVLGFKSTSSRTKGHGLALTDSARDTLFIPGRAGRYYGGVRIDAQLVRVIEPSRLFNLLTLGAAGRLMGLFNPSGPVTASGEMLERVLVVRDLVRPDGQPRGNPAWKQIPPTPPRRPGGPAAAGTSWHAWAASVRPVGRIRPTGPPAAPAHAAAARPGRGPGAAVDGGGQRTGLPGADRADPVGPAAAGAAGGAHRRRPVVGRSERGPHRGQGSSCGGGAGTSISPPTATPATIRVTRGYWPPTGAASTPGCDQKRGGGRTRPRRMPSARATMWCWSWPCAAAPSSSRRPAGSATPATGSRRRWWSCRRR